MAARDDTKIVRTPGRLYKTPTNLAASATYGTELGAVRACKVRFMGQVPFVLAEEYGCMPVEGGEPADWIMFECLIRQWDDAAVASMFSNTSTGSSSGKKLVTGAAKGTIRAGHNRSAAVDKYIFIPDNIADHEAIYMPRGMPFIVRPSEAMWSVLQERCLEIGIVSLPDGASSLRTYQMGRLADMTL